MNKLYKNVTLTLGTLLILNPISSFALSKEETVYANLSASGKIKNITVSEHLINDEKLSKINDYSKLTNIKNINGDETFISDNNKLTWESNGNDIYYQGSTDKELPVSTKIKYYLDGKEISKKDLKGKKGHVKIEVKYINNLSNKVNGKTLYTPFVVATETIIPTKGNTNVTVTNGKVISTGVNYAVTGLTSPGLYDSLNISSLQNLDKITIEYDTDKYKSSPIYSVVTSKIVDDEDFSKLNDASNVFNQVNQLVNGSKQILNGSKSLLDGTNELKNGTEKLNNGASSLNSGINSAYDGANQIKTALDSSINQLNNDNSDALDQEKLNYIQSQAVNQAALTDEQKNYISANAISEVKKNPTYIYINNNYQAGLEQVAPLGITDATINICANQPVDVNYQAVCSNTSLKDLIFAKQMLNIMEGTASQTAVETAESVAVETTKKVSTSVASQVANQVKLTAKDSTVASLNLLSQNVGKLRDGLGTIKNGANELVNGTNDLNNGTTKLNNGANDLYQGITKFNNSGINKIDDLVNNKIKNKLGDVKELKKLSDNYTSFGSKDNSCKGNTKFILVTK